MRFAGIVAEDLGRPITDAASKAWPLTWLSVSFSPVGCFFWARDETRCEFYSPMVSPRHWTCPVTYVGHRSRNHTGTLGSSIRPCCGRCPWVRDLVLSSVAAGLEEFGQCMFQIALHFGWKWIEARRQSRRGWDTRAALLDSKMCRDTRLPRGSCLKLLRNAGSKRMLRLVTSWDSHSISSLITEQKIQNTLLIRSSTSGRSSKAADRRKGPGGGCPIRIGFCKTL